MADEHITDLYGFSHRATVQQQAQRLQCEGTTRRGALAWSQHVGVAAAEGFPPGPKLKQLTRQGVPPPLRTLVWLEVSGARQKQAAVSANYFNSMALAGEASPFLKAIDKDVQHTCTSHPWLAAPDGQAALRRVLGAYSVHAPRIGYARGMNSIAALLLVVLNRNQEAAFWLLAALVEDILAPDTFSTQLVGCQVELKALDELIADKLPRLSAHLVTLEADVSTTLGAEWWLTAFSTSMPSETVARVWDSLLLEGNKVMFRVALAILKAQEEALLAFDNAGELLLAVRTYTAACHDADALLRTAFEGIGSLPLAAIERCRHERGAEVTAAVQERASGAPGPTQRTGSGEGVHEHLGELGAKAGVLGKQAASNLRKGLASLTASARELATKRGGGGGD